MESKQYQALAIKTESIPATLNINQTALHAALTMAIAVGHVMDQVKRRLYYGAPLTLEKTDKPLQAILKSVNYLGYMLTEAEDEANKPMSEEDFAKLALQPELENLKLENLNIRLLHAAIGGFTENGEKLEALIAQFEKGTLDLINFAEENGDCQWYNAIEIDELGKLAEASGLNAVDFTERGLRVKNITKLQGNAKLKGRYAAGDFDAVAALNRDLDNERALLETDATGELMKSPANAAHLEASIKQLRDGEAKPHQLDESEAAVMANGEQQKAA